MSCPRMKGTMTMNDERAAAGYDGNPPPPPPVVSEGEPMTLAERRAVSYERHRQIMRRLSGE